MSADKKINDFYSQAVMYFIEKCGHWVSVQESHFFMVFQDKPKQWLLYRAQTTGELVWTGISGLLCGLCSNILELSIIFIFSYFSSSSSETVLYVDWCNMGNVCNLCSCLFVVTVYSSVRQRNVCRTQSPRQFSHLDSKVYRITSYYLLYMHCVLEKSK